MPAVQVIDIKGCLMLIRENWAWLWQQFSYWSQDNPRPSLISCLKLVMAIILLDSSYWRRYTGVKTLIYQPCKKRFIREVRLLLKPRVTTSIFM